MSFEIKSPHDVAQELATRMRALRLNRNWSQMTLSKRSGVSYGTLKKFEASGKISLESFLKLAFALDILKEFNNIFQPSDDKLPDTLDELLVDNTRKRGQE
ncbi:MAG: helix-turn-helix domain-containing protein [Alphaproteobacteria bacterium]